MNTTRAEATKNTRSDYWKRAHSHDFEELFPQNTKLSKLFLYNWCGRGPQKCTPVHALVKLI